MARSKVKSRSHHDVAHLLPLSNVPSKYQLPTPYSFWNTARTTFFLLPADPDTMGENNTPTALKGCGVKIDIRGTHYTLIVYIINMQHTFLYN